MDQQDEQTTPRATIKTIANLTGLSPSTVSLSLRGGERLSEETRRKVLEAARAVGYVPDRAGVRLRTGKTNVITLVLDGAEDSIDFARHLIQGIGQATAGSAYNLNVAPAFDRSRSLEIVRTIVNQRAADGIVITHTSARDPRVQFLMDARFPFVTHGRTEFRAAHPYYDFDSEGFVRLATERLVARGRKNLLLVVGDNRTNNYHTLVDTFEAATVGSNVRGTVLDEAVSSLRPIEMAGFGEKLAQQAERPDGIICNSELRAAAISGGLQKAGLRLGTDVEVIYKQTSDLLPIFIPHMDSIVEDVFKAGKEVATLLIRRINGEPAEGLQLLGKAEARWRT